MPDLNVTDCLERGIRTAQAGNKLLARLHLLQASELDPDNPKCWLWLAWVAESPQAAVDSLRQLLNLQPNNELAQTGLAWVQALAEFDPQADLAETTTVLPAATESAAHPQSTQSQSAVSATPSEWLTSASEQKTVPEASNDVSEVIAAEETAEAANELPGQTSPSVVEHEEQFVDSEGQQSAVRHSMPAEDTTEAQRDKVEQSALDETADVFEEPTVAVTSASPTDEQESFADVDTAAVTDVEPTFAVYEQPEEQVAESGTSPSSADHSAADAFAEADPAESSLEHDLNESEPAEPILTCQEDSGGSNTFAADLSRDDETSSADQTPASTMDLPIEETLPEVPAFEQQTPQPVTQDQELVDSATIFEADSPAPLVDATSREGFTAPETPTSVLPVVDSPEAVAAAPVHEQPASAGTENIPYADESQRARVLVVDDSPTVRKLVAMTLEREGYEVTSANDGIDALKEIAEARPQLILMDINMPKLGGYQLCKLVKKHEQTKQIPVIMLSGKDGMFDKMRGKLVGCVDYITKPFDPTDLITKVEKHLLKQAPIEANV